MFAQKKDELIEAIRKVQDLEEGIMEVADAENTEVLEVVFKRVNNLISTLEFDCK